jgi:hypothetical protein
MYTLRCTAKLLKRLSHDGSGPDVEPTTALGDWYANVLNVGHSRFVLLTSERSLLSLVVPAKDLRLLAERLANALSALLKSAQADEALIASELREMEDHRIGKTRSKVVLGSMNDMAINVRTYLQLHPDWSLLEVEENLAIMPCGPIGMKGPGEFAARLLLERHSKWG